jgi:hypothetical protein
MGEELARDSNYREISPQLLDWLVLQNVTLVKKPCSILRTQNPARSRSCLQRWAPGACSVIRDVDVLVPYPLGYVGDRDATPPGEPRQKRDEGCAG